MTQSSSLVRMTTKGVAAMCTKMYQFPCTENVCSKCVLKIARVERLRSVIIVSGICCFIYPVRSELGICVGYGGVFQYGVTYVGLSLAIGTSSC